MSLLGSSMNYNVCAGTSCWNQYISEAPVQEFPTTVAYRKKYTLSVYFLSQEQHRNPNALLQAPVNPSSGFLSKILNPSPGKGKLKLYDDLGCWNNYE